MLPASPSAVMAVPDRLVADRAETRSTEGSNGQFAGLMAQFTQAPAAAPTTPPQSPNKPAKVAKGPLDRAASKRMPDTHKPLAGPQHQDPKVGTQDSAGSPAKGQASGDAKAEDPTASAAEPKTTPPIDHGIPPKDDEQKACTTALAAGADAPPVDPKAGVLPILLTPILPSPATPKADAPPVDPKGGALSIQPTPILPAPSSVGTSHEATTQPASTPAQADGGSPLLRVLDPPNKAGSSVDARVAGLVPPPTPVPPAPAPIGSEISSTSGTPQLQGAALAAAALAGPAIRRQEAVTPENQTKAIETPSTDTTLILKATGPVEGQIMPRDPIPSAPKATADNTPTAVALEGLPGFSKASTQTSVHPETIQPSLDALPEKLAASPQAPIPHASDGSALAALSTPSRVAETAIAPVQAAPPAPAPPASAPVLQVEGGMRWMVKAGAQEAQLQLHPDSLGQVTIHLRVEGGEVHARLWVTEPASVQAVQEGRPHLELSLKEQGLHLGSFDLQQGHRPFQEAPSAPTYREPSTPDEATARQEAPVPASVSILNPHHVELYA